MAKIWRDQDLSLDALKGKTVAVIGFGSQGSAQAENLRDSGIHVIVGVRSDGPSWAAALSQGFSTYAIDVACKECEILSLLLPENAHKEVLSKEVHENAPEGASIILAHGYTAVYSPQLFRSDLRKLLVAPKAIGPELRRMYQVGKGPAALVSAEPGDIEIAKSYAKALGCGRAAVIESSFREETETDLFGEQAVLCGGLMELASAGFETLIEAGYDFQIAYFECLFEIKLIADLMIERGIAGMADSISDTAQFGAMTAGSRIIGPETRKAMKEILSEIQSGQFASRWEAEQNNNSPRLAGWRESLRTSALEQARRSLHLD